MACTLTYSQSNDCKDGIGGIVKFELADFGTLGSATMDADEITITTFDGTPTWFEYDVKSENNNYTENVISDPNAGTTYFEQVLTVQIPKLSAEMTKELKIIAYGNPHVRITDNLGNQLIMGLSRGADMTTGSIVSGAAMADFNGYNLVLTAKEPGPANFYTGV